MLNWLTLWSSLQSNNNVLDNLLNLVQYHVLKFTDIWLFVLSYFCTNVFKIWFNAGIDIKKIRFLTFWPYVSPSIYGKTLKITITSTILDTLGMLDMPFIRMWKVLLVLFIGCDWYFLLGIPIHLVYAVLGSLQTVRTCVPRLVTNLTGTWYLAH